MIRWIGWRILAIMACWLRTALNRQGKDQMKLKAIASCCSLLALMTAGVQAIAQEALPSSNTPQIEESDTTVLSPPSPHWIYVNTNWTRRGTRIFDGDSGKMVAQINEAEMSNFAVDPAGRYYYVAETIWTKGNRGTRQDMLTVYNANTLKLVREITLSGRLLAGNRKHNLSISTDGRYAFVYNMDPASSITVVDLQKGRVAGSTEVPGCGLSAGAGGRSSLSLCADGALALVSLDERGKASLSRSDSFFSAENDPIFDNFPIDETRSRATFVSYSGLVTTAELAGGIKVSPSWSLQGAAGLPRGEAAPLVTNWYPGGRQPSAMHGPSGRLYVLMHIGEFWTQKEPGTELWIVDTQAKKVIRRMKLEDEASWVEVSQDASPLLFLAGEKGLHVLDAMTLEEKHKIKETGAGPMSTIAVRGL